MLYKRATPKLLRAAAPGCCAALIYTAKGARKVLDLCSPVFQAMDVMLPELIRRGMLEAYLISPPLFHQDNAWGQGQDSKSTDKGAHAQQPQRLPAGLSRPYCRQEDSDATRMPSAGAFTLHCTRLHLLAHMLPGREGGTVGAEGKRGSGSSHSSGAAGVGVDYCGEEEWSLLALVRSPQLQAPVPNDGSVAFFTAAQGEQFDVFVGEWRPALGIPLVLQLPARSVCFEKTECRFKVVFESEGTITAVSDLALALLPVL